MREADLCVTPRFFRFQVPILLCVPQEGIRRRALRKWASRRHAQGGRQPAATSTGCVVDFNIHTLIQ